MSIATDRINKALVKLHGVVGELAVYTPLSDPGNPVNVQVVPRLQDEDFGGFGAQTIRAGASLFDVLASVIAAPEVGSTLSLGAVSYVVKSFKTDDEDRLVWIFDCDKV